MAINGNFGTLFLSYIDFYKEINFIFKIFFQRTDRKKSTKSGIYRHGLVITGNWLAT